MTDHVTSKTAALTKIGLIAALYAALTLVVAPISYGAIQLRLSEGLNHLAVFNKRYILGLTLGCAIANLFSPLGLVDIVFGTFGTLLMTSFSYLLTRYVHRVPLKLVCSTVVCTLMSFTVAIELHVVNQLPFWPTYLTVALGELISMAIGGVVVFWIQKRINLTN